MIGLVQIHEPGQTPLPHQEDDLAVGIDLGTTNSLVSYAENGRAEVIRDSSGCSIVPSVVSYHENSIVVGEEARKDISVSPERVVTSIKRLMGRGEEDIQRIGGQLPYQVDTSNTDPERMVRILIAGRSLTPVEISADILRHIKSRAESSLGVNVSRAVITVPAHFDDSARTATKDAARLAGIETLRLINEPTAAALAYELDQRKEGFYAVYDLGGGTFDVSILQLKMGVFQVLATGGDVLLGGDDFDQLIAQHFIDERVEKFGELALSHVDAKKILLFARSVKEYLTDKDTGSWTLKIAEKSSEHTLDRTTLNKIIDSQIQRTLGICLSVINDAKLTISDIRGVVLVGGSTRIPEVRRRVVEFFDQDPLDFIDPEEVVALGAAKQAHSLTKGSDSILLDVTPLSLGIETMGGLVEKIIPRNTTVPASRAQEFTTYQDGQTSMIIHAVQGERELVSENRSLARFELNGIPPMAAGAARIRVVFSVDTDGLLTVSAEETTTNQRQQVSVKPSYGISNDEMMNMLRESLESAEEDMNARLLAEARVDGGRMLNAVEAALIADGDLLAEFERKMIISKLDDLKNCISKSDRAAILSCVEDTNIATEAFAAKRMDRGIREGLRGQDLDHLEKRLTKNN